MCFLSLSLPQCDRVSLLRCLSSGCCDNTTAWGAEGAFRTTGIHSSQSGHAQGQGPGSGVSGEAPFLGHRHCHLTWRKAEGISRSGLEASPGLWAAGRVLPCPQGPSLYARDPTSSYKDTSRVGPGPPQ